MPMKKLEFGVRIVLGLDRGQMVEDHKAGTKTEPSLYVLRPIPYACMLSEKRAGLYMHSEKNSHLEI